MSAKGYPLSIANIMPFIGDWEDETKLLYVN
jgi:hypothetical protein